MPKETSKSGPSKSRAKVVKMLHRVSLLPTSAFTLFRSPKPSLDIINTSLSASSSRRWDSFSSLLSPIITLIFRRLHLKLLRCLHQPVVPLLYFPFGALGKRMVHQMGEEAKAAGFLVVVKQILILATHPQLREINNSQNKSHSGLLVMGVTRGLRTYDEKWCHIERVWIWDNWEIQRFDFSSLWMWLLHRLRYNNGTDDKSSTASVPSSSISLIQIPLKLCLTLVLLIKTLLHHPLRDFVSALYANYTQPLEFCAFLIYTWKRRALVSKTIAFQVTIATWASSLALPVYPWWSRWRSRDGRVLLLARKTFRGFQVHGFENEEAKNGGRDGWDESSTLYLELLTRWTSAERYGCYIHTTSC